MGRWRRFPGSSGLPLVLVLAWAGLGRGAGAPAPAPLLPGRVDLLQTARYPNARGGLTVVGVAQNNTGHALSGLDIALTLRGADQRPVALGVSGDYGVAYLPAGARLPFALALPEAPPPWVTPRWDLVPHAYDPTGWRDRWLAARLAVVRVRRAPPDGAAVAWRLVGTIRNLGVQAARLVAVHGALYDAAGRVLDAAYVNLPVAAIPPGGQAPFTLAFPRVRRGGVPAAQDLLVTGVTP